MIISVLDGLYNEEVVGHLNVARTEFVVIEGNASGADYVAHWWATKSPMHSYNENADDPVFEHLCFLADWGQYGKAAGPIRNQQMLDEGQPTLVIAFHDDLENSKGTKDMVKRAKKAEVPIWHMKHL